MRSAIRLLREPDDAAVALQAELKWLGNRLGPARDWDVLLDETLPPILREYERSVRVAGSANDPAAALLAAAKRRRARARRSAREALASNRFAALTTALERWLASPAVPTLESGTVTQLAARELRKRQRRLLADAADVSRMPPEQRHRIRIAVKRLRYAADFFASLFQKGATQRHSRELGLLQDALGALNDSATAERLLGGLPGARQILLHERLAARESDSLAASAAALKRLAERKPFWSSAARPRR